MFTQIHVHDIICKLLHIILTCTMTDLSREVSSMILWRTTEERLQVLLVQGSPAVQKKGSNVTPACQGPTTKASRSENASKSTHSYTH